MDLIDTLRITMNKGTTSSYNIDNINVPLKVPEPATLALLGLGLAGLGFSRRKQ